MSLEQKKEKLTSLVSDQNALMKTAMILREEGHDELADSLDLAIANVSFAINVLSKQTLDEWIAVSKHFDEDIETSCVELRKHLIIINKDMKNLKKLSKVVGAIDNVAKSIVKTVS